jgi:hypothetical protein
MMNTMTMTERRPTAAERLRKDGDAWVRRKLVWAE